MKNRIFCGLLVAALAIFAACGGNRDDFAMFDAVADMAPAAMPEMEADEMNFGRVIESFDIAGGVPVTATTPGQADWEEVAGENERHIIQTASLEMETEDFDATVTRLRALAPDADGYVESEMLTNHGRRVFTIVMRVPAARFESVLSQVEALATIRTANQRAEDVTDAFYDMAGSLEARRIEEERILALIDDAENITDLLALETRLTNTRLSIETYLATLNNMAGRIRYSTISVTLFDMYTQEIIAAAPTFGERIGGAFGESVDSTISAGQNIVVFLAGAVIPLAILAVLVYAGFLLARGLRRRLSPQNLYP